jgi:hypothetical protein
MTLNETTVRYFFKCAKKEKNTIFIRLPVKNNSSYLFNILRTIVLENGYQKGALAKGLGSIKKE